MGELVLKNLTIQYGGTPVIQNFSLEVFEGEMVALLGPSKATISPSWTSRLKS